MITWNFPQWPHEIHPSAFHKHVTVYLAFPGLTVQFHFMCNAIQASTQDKIGSTPLEKAPLRNDNWDRKLTLQSGSPYIPSSKKSCTKLLNRHCNEVVYIHTAEAFDMIGKYRTAELIHIHFSIVEHLLTDFDQGV
uniref:Uncharacterized protein n=1 Tax=Physcomitrium patens TaxID=3218 RepID=A0A2K1L6D6_PHYPA|nr:hypothetical protein PHYPA_000028 [Physcomitrium patens]